MLIPAASRPNNYILFFIFIRQLQFSFSSVSFSSVICSLLFLQNAPKDIKSENNILSKNKSANKQTSKHKTKTNFNSNEGGGGGGGGCRVEGVQWGGVGWGGVGIVVEGDIMHWEPRPRYRKENFPQLTRARV